MADSKGRFVKAFVLVYVCEDMISYILMFLMWGISYCEFVKKDWKPLLQATTRHTASYLFVFIPVTTRLSSLSGDDPLPPRLSLPYGSVIPQPDPITLPNSSDPSTLPLGTHGSAVSRIHSVLKLLGTVLPLVALAENWLSPEATDPPVASHVVAISSSHFPPARGSFLLLMTTSRSLFLPHP